MDGKWSMRKLGRSLFYLGLILTIGLIGLFVVAAQFLDHSFFLPIYLLPFLALVTLVVGLVGLIILLIAEFRE